MRSRTLTSLRRKAQLSSARACLRTQRFETMNAQISVSNQIHNLLSDRVMSTSEIVCLSVAHPHHDNLHTLKCFQNTLPPQPRKSHNPSCSVLLSRNQLLRVEELAVCSSAHLGYAFAVAYRNLTGRHSTHLVHNSRLQIDLRFFRKCTTSTHAT